MKKSFLLYASILILFFINIIQFYNFFKLDHNFKKLKGSYLDQISIVDQIKKENADLENIRFFSENIEFNYNIPLKDVFGNQLILGDVISPPTLIFYIPELACNSCYEEHYSNLYKTIEKIGKDNILILANYENERDLYSFVRSQGIEVEVYNLNMQNLGIKAEITNDPFFFLIDEDGIIRHVFILDKKSPNANISYLNNIINRYFK